MFPITHCVSLVSHFVPQFVPCLPMLSLPAGSWAFEPCLLQWFFSCLPQPPIISNCLQGVFQWPPKCFPLVTQLSPSCRTNVISQLYSNCLSLASRLCPSGLPNVSWMWFPRCCLPIAPKFLHLPSSCIPLSAQMWFPTSCLPVRLLFLPSPGCGPPVVS